MNAINKRHIERLFSAKRQRRMDLAGLSIEEKVKILVHLQQIASLILKARGLKREPWKVS
ncbi:MAG: hypothetical protein HYT75_04500 [Deltaproteobacteria bacterium]|nr:hypothetical protein [Deltaproteobacteria bacterium]